MKENSLCVNPWFTDNVDRFLINGLHLAKQSGYVHQDVDGDSNFAVKLNGLPSTKMIDIQKEITKNNISIQQINEEVQHGTLCDESNDIIGIPAMELKINLARKISDHVQMILDNKEFIVSTLQQPLVGDFIKAGAEFHKDVFDVYTIMASLLSSLSAYLDSLTCASDLSQASLFSQLDDLIVHISSSLANIQTTLQSVTSMSNNIQRMHYLQLCKSPEVVKFIE